MRHLRKYMLGLVALGMAGLLICLLSPSMATLPASGCLAFVTLSQDKTAVELTHVENGVAGQVEPLASFKPAPDGRIFWSPDGKTIISEINGVLSYWQDYIIDPDNHTTIQYEFCSHWGGFKRWTTDSRYAIFECGDQYSDTSTSVFDTWNWAETINTAEKCPSFGTCRSGLLAVSPASPDILLKDGTLVHLASLSETAVIPHLSDADEAAWSPDGEYLAITQWRGYPECNLYLARGDGAQAQQISILDSCFGKPIWEYEGHRMTFQTESYKYILDADSRNLQVLASARQQASQITPNDPCSDVSHFLSGESTLGKVTTACWSPQKSLLATGDSNVLKIYDSNLTLLSSLTVSGTIRQISWSPVQ